MLKVQLVLVTLDDCIYSLIILSLQVFYYDAAVDNIMQKDKQPELSPQARQKNQRRKATVMRLFRRNQQREGDNLLEQVCTKDKKLLQAVSHYHFAVLCMQGNDINTAEEHLNKAAQVIEARYPFSNYHMYLGTIWTQRKNYQKAIWAFQAAIQNSPHHNPEQYAGKMDIVFSKHLNSYNAYADAHTNISVMFVQLDQIERAFDYCKKAIEIKPQSSEAQINFTDILRQLGRKNQAIDQSWKSIVEHTRKNGKPKYEKFQGINIEAWSAEKDKQQQGQANKPEQQTRISILTVKWGNRYNAEYVNKLYHGIVRNTTWRVTFYCFTDDPIGLDPDIKIKQLEEGWKKWWGKCTLFNTDIPGKKFYIDLDMIIVGSLDQLFSYNGTFATLRSGDLACQKNHKDGYNSSVMIWKDDQLKPVYETLKENFEAVGKFIVRFDFWLQMTIRNADYVQVLFPGKVIDFLADAQTQLPQGSSVVCFARKPKPEDYPAPWVKEHWIL